MEPLAGRLSVTMIIWYPSAERTGLDISPIDNEYAAFSKGIVV